MEAIKNILSDLGVKVYPMSAEPGAKPPYIVYGQDGANDLQTDGIHSEKAAEGTIDLYTADIFDPLKKQIEDALDGLAGTKTVAWRLNSIQIESGAGPPKSGYAGMIHFEWIFQAGGQ